MVLEGLEEVQKSPGYHDEKLKGKLVGLRSIRLNRSYRVIYGIEKDQMLSIEFVEVKKANNHEYKR